MNGNDSEGFRGKLLWNLDNGTEVLLTADYENQYRTGIAATARNILVLLMETTNAACGVVPSEEENFSTCMNHPSFNEMEHPYNYKRFR